jgi:hypothetical protein
MNGKRLPVDPKKNVKTLTVKDLQAIDKTIGLNSGSIKLFIL